jgi:peptide/nickel transport system substrate-binding protein
MTNKAHFNSHRRALLQAAGACTIGATVGAPLQAFAQPDAGLLRAGITGFNVINTLDPAKASLLSEYYVVWATFNSLLKFDAAKMNIVPDLAESFRVVDGALEFKLRPNVRFHDGSLLTADDVKFTFERLADAKTASPNRAKFSNLKSVTVVDSRTVRLHVTKGLAALLPALTNTRTGSQIVSREVFRKFSSAELERKPIGTGAYMVTNWQPNALVQLAAHKTYFEPGLPRIARVDMPLIPEESSGMRAILGGQLDLTSTAPFSDVKALDSNKDVRVLRQAGLNSRYITLNTRRAPFDDVHFRRAFSMAIDRDVLVKAVLFGDGLSTGSLIPPGLKRNAAKGLPPLAAFDPAAARAEMAKSRYGKGTKAVVLGWGSAWWKRFAEIAVAQVNQVLGTEIRVEVFDSNTVYSRLKAFDFDAAVWGWLGLSDPDEFLGEVVGTGQWRNFQQYSNPQVDALLERGRDEIDPVRREKIYADAEALVLEDMPVIPCFVSNIHNLTTARLSGFSQLPYGNFGDQFKNIRL